jgi:hypothetical protein
MLLVLTVALLSLACISCGSQSTPPTTQGANKSSPEPRWGQSMAHDPDTRKVIVFGGTDVDEGPLGDTWILDPAAKTWSLLHPSVSPPARGSQAMVFDPVTGKIIMFGGVDWDFHSFSDTWAFDPATTTWTQIHTEHSPDARDSCALERRPGAEPHSARRYVAL